MGNGKLIVIEGLDGSGKATQSKKLCENIMRMGKTARRISFPDYDSPSSALVKMYLNKELGTMDEINPYGASLFYTVDRYASYLKDWKEYYQDPDTIVVADRYTTSNIPFQMSKLPMEEWWNYIRWLEDLEYRVIGIPKPDLVVYLDMDPDVSWKLISERYHGDESKRDLHESDFAYQQRCRSAALFGAKMNGWIIINCCNGGEMAPIEMIQSSILAEVAGRWFS